MEEKAQTNAKIAVHAAKSDVGVAADKWTPQDRSNKTNALALSEEKTMMNEEDISVKPKDRGKQKIGGHLAPIQLEGTDTKARRPLLPSLAGEMEFNRNRRKQKLGDRLAEIAELRDKIQQERAALDASIAAAAEAERRKAAKLIKKPTKAEELLARLTAPSKKSNVSTLSHSASVPDGLVSEYSPRKTEVTDVSGHEEPIDGKPSSAPIISEVEADPNLATFIKIDQKLEELGKEESNVEGEFEHFVKIEKTIKSIKSVERKANNREKSREIERKRRLLNEKEGKRKGPPADEPQNQYDYYATRIEKVARGFVGRRFAIRHRKEVTKAVVVLQSGFRGMFARSRVRRLRTRYNAATYIQANYRGWKARVSYFSLYDSRLFDHLYLYRG